MWHMSMTVERRVQADRGTVWRTMSDLDRWAEMVPTVTEISRVDGGTGPVTVGSRFRVRQPGLMPATYEITDWRPDEGFTWVARSAGVRTRADHWLRSDGAAVRLRLGIEWTGAGARLVRLLYGSRTRRFLKQEAAAFARLAERPAGER
ncbi:polyketide cyclase [Micromonospora fluostatini]|uniref:Polyketide cyclase n=2 Tax=Micromonospora TaxID=1873 RepID=A0ABY2DCW6_9ACTN|nr:polyketide cyclase [Micromonospora fluostatini]